MKNTQKAQLIAMTRMMIEEALEGAAPAVRHYLTQTEKALDRPSLSYIEALDYFKSVQSLVEENY